MEYQIYKANIDDAQELLELQRSAFQLEAVLYNNYNIDPLTQTLESIQNDFNDYVFLKAVCGSEIIGSIKLRMHDDTCWLGRLMVDYQYQRKGVGRELLLEAEKIFPGVKAYHLFTGNKSVNNIRLYESLGYRFTREFTEENNPELVLVKMVKRV